MIRFLAVITLIATPLLGSSLWGSLEPGTHQVGFRTVRTYDLSRPPVRDVELGSQSVRGRPIQISIWYPARRSNRMPLPFGTYVDLLAQIVDFTPVDAARRASALKRFEEQPRDLGGNVEELRKRAELLLKTPTAAISNSSPAPGTFPAVIFVDYRAPATNSILAEYLASHGFVVATTAMVGTHDTEYDAGLTGIETTARDIEFILATLADIPSVDRKRVGLIGLGIAASACLTVAMRNPEVDALVSLDGGIPTQYEDSLLKRTPYYNLGAVRIPILAIHAPHPNVEPRFFDQYRYSTRYLAHFPAMSEFFFLNYGMFEGLGVVPGVAGKAPGDTRAGFEQAAVLVKHFLAAELQQSQESRTFLGQPLNPGIATLEVKRGLRAPPSLAELKALFRERGIGAISQQYESLKKDDPAPFTQQMFSEFAQWLAWHRDEDWSARREWSRLRVDAYPESARAHFALANAALQRKEVELARKHYADTLRLLDLDRDPVLDDSLRARIRDQANRALSPSPEPAQ